MTFEELKPKVNDILTETESLNDEKLKKICHLLRDNIDYYDWVGFYFANGDKPELILGPFAGEDTDHKVIPFGKGICGQVAVSNETFISQDVHSEENYLACSIETKAEIVVPIFKNGENIGQIDIDSHYADSITKEDEELLNYITEKVSKII